MLDSIKEEHNNFSILMLMERGLESIVIMQHYKHNIKAVTHS